jgi:hypothetical protein
VTRKRPQIKGQGANLYLDGSAPDPEKPLAKKDADRVMVTVYLPPALVEELDQRWLERRRRDKKAQKSHIVAEALAQYFQA